MPPLTRSADVDTGFIERPLVGFQPTAEPPSDLLPMSAPCSLRMLKSRPKSVAARRASQTPGRARPLRNGGR